METTASEKLLGQWWKLRLGHEAMMLQDAQQLLKQDRAGTKAHVENTNGRPMENETDDMIHIGDRVTHVEAPAKGGVSKLAAAGLVAASLVGGAGLAGLMHTQREALRSPPAIAPAKQEYDVRFKIKWDGKEWKEIEPTQAAPVK